MAIVRLNRDLEAEMTHSLSNRGPMERVLGEAAETIAARARAIGRAEYYRRGGYVRGIHAEAGTDERGELVGRVAATDWKSHWGERPPRQERGGRRGHILERAAGQVGFEVVAGEVARALLGPLGGMAARGAISARNRRAITPRR